MLRRAAVALVPLLALLLGLVVAPTANAEQTCYKTDPRTGICVIWIEVGGGGGTGGGGDTGGGGGGGGTGGGGGSDIIVLVIDGVRCTYAGVKDPQPAKDDPVWEGHTNGAIYACEVAPQVRPGSIIAGYQLPFWATAPPALPPPDPAVLAQQALAAMNLQAVTIGIVPEPRAGSIGVIGMPTWMWVNNPTQTTMGPITRSASARGYTVSATARVNKIVWNMGDGSSIACTGAGTPYADSYGKRSSPTCGHTYIRPGSFAVSATSYWEVAWAGIGQTGVIAIDFTSSATITMGEVQVLSQ